MRQTNVPAATIVPTLADLIDLYQFPAGRAAHACKSVHRMATELGEDVIARSAAETVELAGMALTKRREYYATKQRKRRHANPTAVLLDAKLDRAVGALHGGLQTAARTFDASDALGARAATALQRVFPRGAVAITTLSFEEEQEAIGEILSLMQGELSSTFAQLGLTIYVQEAARLHAEFVEALGAEPKPKVSFEQVRSADARVQRALLTTVVRVMGRFATTSEEDVSNCARLLGPIVLQNDRIREGYRRHRPVPDVDPDSGEEQPETVSGAATPSA